MDRYKELLKRIAGRLTCIDYWDLTKAEKQILQMLEEEKFVVKWERKEGGERYFDYRLNEER